MVSGIVGKLVEGFLRFYGVLRSIEKRRFEKGGWWTFCNGFYCITLLEKFLFDSIGKIINGDVTVWKVAA